LKKCLYYRPQILSGEQKFTERYVEVVLTLLERACSC